MASTNQSPFYKRAEEEFLQATTLEEKLQCLEIMIKECPKHKSSENMLKNLTMRKKRFLEQLKKQKKSGGSTKKGIRKHDMQACLIGFTNVGKSSLFKLLTKKETKISPHEFTTYESEVGMMDYEDTQIQIIDSPPFPNEDKSTINSADTMILIVDNLEQIKEADKFIWKSPAKKLLIYNKSDLLSEQEKRKLKATLKSKYKKWKAFIISTTNPNQDDLQAFKIELFKTFPIIRVYTKEPKKEATKKPMILKENSTLEQAAEKILKGMSKKIKRARIWGPSSKFPGQGIGLEHHLKDKDIIEFQTK
jgi:ribosome-interacting GTPase 1